MLASALTCPPRFEEDGDRRSICASNGLPLGGGSSAQWTIGKNSNSYGHVVPVSRNETNSVTSFMSNPTTACTSAHSQSEATPIRQSVNF